MHKRTILTASAIVAVGCIAIPTGAYAANGGAWLLGRSNSESATTTVTNSAGTPLALNSKSGYAPLKVNRTTKVLNLNADLLDGYNASSFARSTPKTGTIVHDGSTDYVGAKCPSGTTIVSGGGVPSYGYALLYSGPDWNPSTGAIIPNSWYVVDDEGYSGISYVTCVNPSGGAVAGAITNQSQLFPSAVRSTARVTAPQVPAKNDRFASQIKH